MHPRIKALAGAGLALVTAGGAAVAAAVPDEASDGLDRAEAETGFELPASADAHPTADDHPGGPAEAEVTVEETGTDDGADDTGAAELPEASTFGQSVAAQAQSGVPQDDGAAFGAAVSDSARDAHQPESAGSQAEGAGGGTANAPTDNPGAEHRP